MRIAVACDHAGFPLKEDVIQIIRAAGHEVIDLGAHASEPVDYPDFTYKAGQAVVRGQADRAVVICGSGVGATITANKIKGIYACLCHDTYSARQGVEHDNMNILCLGARIIGVELAKELVRSFLAATMSTEERHLRRVGKIRAIEQEN
ncbi:MAG: ribose 5-phosphate isomerase B [Chloroflexota bacterium]|jgi:ribose 5-phosphate isomerase B